MPTRLLLCLALLLSLAAPAGPGRAGERVTVFAAASLKETMDEIAAGFRVATGHDVTISLAGSSALARQIQAGAPADIFVSANAAWMDVLERDGLIVPDSRFDLAGNRLVLIAPRTPDQPSASPIALGPGTDLAARLGGGRLAVALTEAVPAGIYAKSALTALGLWDGLADRLAQADNVRTALTLVALGEAPLGVVYATDAAADPRVRMIATFPADSHPAIVYPAARIAGRDSAAIDIFLAWLKGAETQATLARHGFEVLK